MTDKIKIYLASPFFYYGGRCETEFLATELESAFGDRIELYVPHRNGDINDKSGNELKMVTGKDIARGDNRHLMGCDILIANLDGSEIDSGVSAEIGYVAGYNSLIEDLGLDKKYIIGYTTDIRINKTSQAAIDAIKDGTVTGVDFVDNLKVNNLYKNLYTIGLVQMNGIYTVLHNGHEEILEIVRDLLEHNF